MSFPNTLSWYKNVFFLSPQVSSSMMPAVDTKILSFFTENPFCMPDVTVLLAALDWRRSLSEVGFSDIDAFPGQSGEILVSAIMGDFCFEVTVERDLSLSVAFERGENQIFAEDELSIGKAKEWLSEAVRWIWISSVGFTQFNSMAEWGKIALKALPSRTLQGKAVAFPS
jgi:hypothetical protein